MEVQRDKTSSNVKVDVQNIGEEPKLKNTRAQCVRITAENSVKRDDVSVLETNDVVCGGACDGSGQPEQVQSRRRRGQVDGLLL